MGLLALAGRLPAGSTGIRRVSWFNGGGGWTVGIDGLNYSEWVATNRAAITGVMPCCGCWAVEPTNGTFYATGRCASKTGSPASIANWATAASAGLVCRIIPHLVDSVVHRFPPCHLVTVLLLNQDRLPTQLRARSTPHRRSLPESVGVLGFTRSVSWCSPQTIEPTGGFEIDYILGEGWAAHPGSLATAMAMLEREGWSGFGIDNENYPPSMPPALPTKFGWLLGNLSLVAAEVFLTRTTRAGAPWVSPQSFSDSPRSRSLGRPPPHHDADVAAVPGLALALLGE